MTEPNWHALIPELSEWNNGKGVDPAGWLSAMGNFQLACAYTTMFSPRFVEHDGMILREGFSQESLVGFIENCAGNKTAIEWVMNHIHLVDVHHVGCPDASRERIVYLGHVLKEIYECKLAVQFPTEDIVVEFDDSYREELFAYQLSFFKQRDG
jgi:hypothetical protein